MTNSVAIVIVLYTNWISVGTFTDTLGRRYEEQACLVQTNLVARSIVTITNDVILRSSESQTNGVTRRIPQLPSIPSKL